jgi:CRP-like cAMP-binding protein
MNMRAGLPGLGAELQGLGAELPRDAWSALLQAGTARRFRARDVLVRQGDPGTHVLALTAGRVKAVRSELDGNEILLAVRGPGEVIGVIAVMDGGARSATVTAMEPCVTYVLPAERFRGFLSEAALQGHLIRHVLARHREGDAVRAELAAMATLPRVARALLRHASPSPGGGRPPEISLSQRELALSVGLSRSALAADLAELRKRGLISTGRQRIEIRDAQGLGGIGVAGYPAQEAPSAQEAPAAQ